MSAFFVCRLVAFRSASSILFPFAPVSSESPLDVINEFFLNLSDDFSGEVKDFDFVSKNPGEKPKVFLDEVALGDTVTLGEISFLIFVSDYLESELVNALELIF